MAKETTNRANQVIFGGVAEADGICQTLADAVPSDGNDIAWIPDSCINGKDGCRFWRSTTPDQLVGGLTAGNNFLGLSGARDRPADLDENGNTATHEPAGSGTNTSGLHV